MAILKNTQSGDFVGPIFADSPYYRYLQSIRIDGSQNRPLWMEVSANGAWFEGHGAPTDGLPLEAKEDDNYYDLDGLTFYSLVDGSWVSGGLLLGADVGSTSLAGDADVSLSTLEDGHVLMYSSGSGHWINSYFSLFDDADVLFDVGPNPGDLIQFDGVHWINVPAVSSVDTVPVSGAAQTIFDPTTPGNPEITAITLTEDCTLTFPTAAEGLRFSLALVQGGIGSFLATWPGEVLWSGGTPPVLTATVGKTDVFSFLCIDGTNWIGLTTGLNF